MYVMIDKDEEGQFLDFMGGHRAHGGFPQSPPPTKENPGCLVDPEMIFSHRQIESNY